MSAEVDRVKPQSSAYLDDLIASIAEGKEVQAEIFETLKNVAKGATEYDVIAEPKPLARQGDRLAVAVQETVNFECPVCATSVDQDATVCPGCGAKFANETIEEFECPACSAKVEASAAQCPSCGVKFAAEAPAPFPSMAGTPAAPRATGLQQRLEKVRKARTAPAAFVPPKDRRGLYKELPRLVNEVKPMLLSAKQLGVDIEEPKRLINEAIAAGKRREIEYAVRLVAEAKHHLEATFTSHIAGTIEGLLVEVERAKAAGSRDIDAVEKLLESSVSVLEGEDFAGASAKLTEAREEFERKAGGYHRAKELLTAAEALLENGRAFGVDVKEAETFIRQGREALGQRDYARATELGERSRTVVMHVLPGVLDDAMKRARNKLLEMKMRGGDLTRAIGLLKQASIHLKREEYGDAMRYVRTFRQETGAW